MIRKEKKDGNKMTFSQGIQRFVPLPSACVARRKFDKIRERK